MKHFSVFRHRRLILAVGIALLAILPLGIYLTGGKAEAQCGTSTSSCKNCPEVQGKDPVSAKGEWHTAHAFGDFCEFCHAGTVEAKTQDEAHVGMVDPLGDVKASCQSCHPQDFQDKAKVYATALGITLGAGGSGSGGGAASGGGASGGQAAGGSGGAAAAGGTGTANASAANASAASTGATAGAAGASAAAAAPSGAPEGELVDYNALYAASQAPEKTLTTGDWVLIVLIGLLLLGLLVAAWKLEHWGDRLLHWWQNNMLVQPPTAYQSAAGAMALPAPGRSAPVSAPVSAPARPSAPTAPTVPVAPAVAVSAAELEELYRRRPELRAVAPFLMNADDKTLQALAVLLAQPGSRDVLLRVSQLDLSLLSALQELAPGDQALLLALAQKRER